MMMAANLKLDNLIAFMDFNDFGGLERMATVIRRSIRWCQGRIFWLGGGRSRRSRRGGDARGGHGPPRRTPHASGVSYR